MHFTWDVSLGQLMMVITIIGLGLRYHRDWVILSERVNEMWVDYESRHGVLERRASARASSKG